MEEFRDIIGYDGLYQVSNLGNVKSLPREVFNYTGFRNTKERILKAGINSQGYFTVILSNGITSKSRTVHSLVAESFLNHISDGTMKKVIDHINDIKTDNRVENLQVVTHRFNVYKTQGKYASKYKGVSFCKKSNKWRSRVMINGKENMLGYFEKEYDAHVAYQNKLLSLSN